MCRTSGAEDKMDHILGVGVGHVSHLRRWAFGGVGYPALTHWANFWRASGARGEVARRIRVDTI